LKKISSVCKNTQNCSFWQIWLKFNHMFGIGGKKVSTESYKGVRDFYPVDQSIQNYIFKVMREVAESYGYLEYGASVLEPLDLYRSKSSEEIVNEQIYSFEDRGGREVALRPEMTPTVARMIATKIQDLPSPIRWYSIPNLFRYEKPQRGRLREHWQLNVDIFGVADFWAEVEVISLASDIMKRYGAKTEDFEIRISSRTFLDEVFKKLKIDESQRVFLYRLIDKKDKLSEDAFKESLITLIGEESAKELLQSFYFGEGLLTEMRESPAAKALSETIETLRAKGVSNVVFSPTLTRGFDYYTGVVFEVYDTNPENPRTIFGGGRYDNLVGNFVSKQIPAFGFGMGDVTTRDFLETHNLLPKLSSTTDLYVCVAPETNMAEVYKTSDILKEKGVNVAIDISGRKLSDQLKSLDKRNIPFVLTVGQEELKNNRFTIRNTESREEMSGSLEEILGFLKNI
jgi:histidyl-tRNA synthetase